MAATTTPPLETPRLLLRPVTSASLAAVHAVWADAGATSWSLFPTHTSPAQSREKLDRLLALPDSHHWTLAPRRPADADADAECVGLVGLLADPKSDAAFPGRATRTVVYALVEGAWGRGYATEALGAMIAAMATAGPEAGGLPAGTRLVAWINAENAGSQRVARKLGFECAGWYRGGRAEGVLVGGVVRPDACPLFVRDL